MPTETVTFPESALPDAEPVGVIPAIKQIFYLDGFSHDIVASKALLDGSDTTELASNAIAEIKLPRSIARHMFQFHSDGYDVNDLSAEDLLYKFVHPDLLEVPSFWTDLYSPGNAFMATNAQISHDALGNVMVPGILGEEELNKVQYDWVRYLANKIFGTTKGVDLFSNELEVRHSVRDNSDTALKAKFQEIHEYQLLNGLQVDIGYDGVTVPALSRSQLTNKPLMGPSKQILDQIINNNPERLINYLSKYVAYHEVNDPDHNNVNAPFFVPVPLEDGDVIAFTLKVKPNAEQLSILNYIISNTNSAQATSTLESVIPDWTYLIKMIIYDDSAESVALSDYYRLQYNSLYALSVAETEKDAAIIAYANETMTAQDYFAAVLKFDDATAAYGVALANYSNAYPQYLSNLLFATVTPLQNYNDAVTVVSDAKTVLDEKEALRVVDVATELTSQEIYNSMVAAAALTADILNTCNAAITTSQFALDYQYTDEGSDWKLADAARITSLNNKDAAEMALSTAEGQPVETYSQHDVDLARAIYDESVYIYNDKLALYNIQNDIYLVNLSVYNDAVLSQSLADSNNDAANTEVINAAGVLATATSALNTPITGSVAVRDAAQTVLDAAEDALIPIKTIAIAACDEYISAVLRRLF